LQRFFELSKLRLVDGYTVERLVGREAVYVRVFAARQDEQVGTLHRPPHGEYGLEPLSTDVKLGDEYEEEASRSAEVVFSAQPAPGLVDLQKDSPPTEPPDALIPVAPESWERVPVVA